ncbi:MAG TPA: aspartate carbamoyltransferase [Exilispira sp.]|jgi:aspartate carbamoyltransferase catalytic subunit|nr:aspartate carbamoyltransferase [Exilispira sp.]HNV43499.1 aspartate carbamoyltransferase [Exilispira sp.]HPO60574.1 aspartate carbamoyltransferase [Exilispira sp.]HQQ18760.1 aspartate carbamoyltransferase [Exilispira sp.]
MKYKGIDIISLHDLDRSFLDYLMKKTKEVKEGKWQNACKGKIVASLFFEPSTRTKLSFDTAIALTGASVIGFSSAAASSTSKGESLSDTIKTIDQYADIIVMRHSVEGAARRAAEVANAPVINAGDGANQHPTQTFLDLFTIFELKERVDNLKIGLMGDLRFGRTIHSLVMALSFYNAELFLISPSILKLPSYYLDYLESKGIKYHELEDFTEVGNELDVLYCTRIQRERFADPVEYQKVANSYEISRDNIESLAKNTIILHPLPRVNEISPTVDDDPRARYFYQAKNGVYTRAALLGIVAGSIS